MKETTAPATVAVELPENFTEAPRLTRQETA